MNGEGALAVEVTKAFADLLIESRGRVLTTGSIAGIVTGPFSGAYSMSKHGVEAYTDALAAEMAEQYRKKNSRLAPEVLRRRLAGFLQRKGFSASIVYPLLRGDQGEDD